VRMRDGPVLEKSWHRAGGVRMESLQNGEEIYSNGRQVARSWTQLEMHIARQNILQFKFQGDEIE
jgi:hypothetical protein